MNNYRIKNRQNLDISVDVRTPSTSGNKKALAFIVHGLGGFKDQDFLVQVAKTLRNLGYTVVSHDAAHTIGESGGEMIKATLTNYFEDLEDVVNWTKQQDFYEEPFLICGHSLGAACTIMFAAKYPNLVKAIIPMSSIAGGDRHSNLHPDVDKQLAEKGYVERPSKSKPETTKRIGKDFYRDAASYDLINNEATQIKAPALFVVGSDDIRTPSKLQHQLANKMQSETTVKIIQGMKHNPRTPKEIKQLTQIISEWAT